MARSPIFQLVAILAILPIFLAHASTTNQRRRGLRNGRRSVVEDSLWKRGLKAEGANSRQWMIAGCVIVAILVLCTCGWVMWRWRGVVWGTLRRQKPAEVHNISEPMIGGYQNKRRSMSDYPSPVFYGNSSMMMMADDKRSTDMGFPSPVALSHSSSQRQLVRTDLLKPNHKNRALLAADKQTFFLDEDEDDSNSSLKPPNTSPLTITVPSTALAKETGYAHLIPPPIPDSPATANMSARYSWMTAQTARTGRTSIESEPPRFRTVHSWVSHQASRVDMPTVAPTPLPLPSVPGTPAEFRHHPGAEVVFVAKHRRMESTDLDRRLDEKSLA